MNATDYVIRPTVQGSLAHHPSDEERPASFTDRLVWISDDKLDSSKLFVSSRGLRELKRGEDDGGTAVHTHDSDQVYLVIADEPELLVEFELDGSVTEVRGPATIYIPAGLPHRLRILEGSGTVVAILLQGHFA